MIGKPGKFSCMLQRCLPKHCLSFFLLNIPLLNLEVAYNRRAKFNVVFAYLSIQAPPPSYETRITTSKLLIELENYEVSFFQLSSSFTMISFKWKSYWGDLVTIESKQFSAQKLLLQYFIIITRRCGSVYLGVVVLQV